MSPRTAPLGAFQKVGECLYRYSNGVYYARLKVNGKEIRRSLKTSDRDMVKRELARLRTFGRRRSSSQSRLAREASDKYYDGKLAWRTCF